MEDKGFSDTKTPITLGGVEYLVNFGILARRRIEEAHPGFTIVGSTMPDFEIIPFLIQKGVDPALRKWKKESDFIEMYEACTDTEGLQRIPLAYQNALGFTNQHFAPWLERASEMFNQIKVEVNPEQQQQQQPEI